MVELCVIREFWEKKWKYGSIKICRLNLAKYVLFKIQETQNCHLNYDSKQCAWPYDNDAKVHFRSRVRKSDHNSFKHEFTTTLFLFQIFRFNGFAQNSRWILGAKLPDRELNSKWILLRFLHFCKSMTSLM